MLFIMLSLAWLQFSHAHRSLVKAAKLLHWTGREKPWRSSKARYRNVFQTYQLPVPMGV
eukprot:m.25397 g.25397  ORF g.25397 m.25397 type:complete len:59 (+) comp11591_c0_seq3:851-1027(+)